jgi:lipopolysaccharide export LptBFGC system permease protein LptF
MRISDRYIGKQVLFGTLFAILVLSLVLVLGSLFREIRPLLVEDRIPPSVVAQFALNILPFSLMFTIPWGFLSAVLLVFGRLSSDQELTGFRVAGISLPRIAAPVFVVALALCGICAWLNVTVVPQAKSAMRTILFRELMRDPRSLLTPGIAEADFKNAKIFIEGKDGDAILGLHLYQVPDENAPNRHPSGYIHAQRVEPPIVDKESHSFKLILDNSFTEIRNNDGTFDRLITGKTNALQVTYVDTRPKIPKPAEMSNDELRHFAAENPQLNEKGRVAVRSEITRRYAYSMACLAFAFVGVPLGIKSRRRDTSGGLILSILVAAGYFVSSMLADQFHTDLSVTTALWAPNVICILLGLWLFRRSRFK